MKIINNDYVSSYLNDAMLFIRTLVFKLEDLAALQNEEIVRLYGSGAVDLNDPTSWKYYMNICGQYHATDEKMTVVSIDTLKAILFTKENLAIHTATAAAYSYGTRDYYTLVSRYPKQVRLINGILLPADMDQAIASKDGTILAYRKDLIESNETTLVSDLETSIQRMLFRWYNTQFNISSSLYASVIVSQIYLLLVPIFLNLRQRRCHTAEVHSFHVRMFLSSHGEVARYLPYLTLEQSLWLYRNIRYIERNAGRNEQFETLISNLLSKRQIPVGSYSVRQIDTFDDYVPRVVARLTPLNSRVNVLSDDVQDISEIYDRELEMAPGNARYLETKQDDSINLLRLSPSTAIQTKVIHSSMVDLSNAVPETFEAVAIRQWCAMANKGLYDSYVTFKDPKTSIVYSLKAIDAFIYFYYVTVMSEGFDITNKPIPRYLNIRQRVNPKPTVEHLLEVVDTEKFDLKSVAEELIAGQPAITPCLSVSAFNSVVTALYKECYRHWFIISATEDYYERALVENMINRLFEDEVTALNFNSSTMASWLHEQNLPVYDYQREEAQSLIVNIYRSATGVVDNTYARLSNIQHAMLSLFEELSSYSIQVTREINETDLVLVNWPAIRAGNVSQSQSDSRNIEAEVLCDLESASGVTTVKVTAVDRDNISSIPSFEKVTTTVTLDAVPDCTVSSKQSTGVDDTASPTLPSLTYDGQDVNIDERYGVIGYTLLNLLTEEQFSNLKSIYK